MNDELTDAERRALDAREAFEPPADFAERIVRARGAERPAPRRWRYIGAAITAAAAAAVIAFVLRSPDQSARGQLSASARTTARLGSRAVVVAEPAASLSWHVDASGETVVEQTAGDVFYRVDEGRAFVIRTPAGTVRVTGTCLRVEVHPMIDKKHLASGAAGAVLAMAVTVVVYEGHVVADARSGPIQLAAGERATIEATLGAAPSTSASTRTAGAMPGLAPEATRGAASCPDQSALAAKLASVEAELESRLELKDKFERGQPAPEAANRFRPVVDRALADRPDSMTYDVECRGTTCQVEIVEPERSDYDWMQKLQSGEIKKAYRGASFHAGSPSRDPISKQAVLTSRSYFALGNGDELSGLDILAGLLKRFDGSAELQSCRREHPGVSGTWNIRLDLDEVHDTITILEGGELSGEPLGQCMRRTLDALIAATPVPPNATAAVMFRDVAP